MKKMMKALIFKEKGILELIDKPVPQIQHPRDAIVRVTLSAICSSDLHIKYGYVPNAKKGTTLGHEFVGEVISIGSDIKNLKEGDRISANCITFCGKCYFCKKDFINNCVNGGWELGCKIDGGQAEYVRVPYADMGLTKIPNNVTDKNALLVGDILATGWFGAEMCEIKKGDTIAVIGSGPVGLCAMNCAKIMGAEKIVALDIDDKRLKLAKEQRLADITINPEKQNAQELIKEITDKRGADGVIEAAGADRSFKLAWQIARPNAFIGIVAMYEKPQKLPLPDMYGKNLTFKTGGVDAVHSKELLTYISEGLINTDFLITHEVSLDDILEGYKIFEEKRDNCIKCAIKP